MNTDTDKILEIQKFFYYSWCCFLHGFECWIAPIASIASLFKNKKVCSIRPKLPVLVYIEHLGFLKICRFIANRARFSIMSYNGALSVPQICSHFATISLISEIP